MDLYGQFVEKWREQFPKDDPPLVDMNGCTNVNKEYETINYPKIQLLYTTAKQTSETLRTELRKAEFIEHFFEDILSTHGGVDLPQSPEDGARGAGRYSLIGGIGKCVDYSLEALVNIGYGKDVIDINENHEIQINAVNKTETIPSSKTNLSADDLSGNTDNEDYLDDSTLSHSSTQGHHNVNSSGFKEMTRKYSDQVNGGMLSRQDECTNTQSKYLPKQLSLSDSKDIEKGQSKHSDQKKVVPCERVPSIKPAVPPRKKPSVSARPRPVITPRSSDNNIANKILQQSKGEPERGLIKAKENASQLANDQIPVSDSQVTDGELQEPDIDLYDNVTFERKLKVDISSSCQSSEINDPDLPLDNTEENMKRFRIASMTGGEKRTSSDVVSKGYRKINDDSAVTGVTTCSENTEQESSTERSISPDSSADKNKDEESATKAIVHKKSSRKERIPDYENFSLDFLVTSKRYSVEFNLDEQDNHSDISKGSQISEELQKNDNISVDSSESLNSLVPTLYVDSDSCRDESSRQESHDVKKEGKKSGNFPSTGRSNDSPTSSPVMKKFERETSSPNSIRASLDVRSEDEDCHSADSHDESQSDSTKRTSFEINKIRSDKLHLRKILVKGILESEKTYLSILKDITELKRSIQNKVTDMWTKNNRICSMEDVTTIFCHIEEIHKKHLDFVQTLQQQVDDWSDSQEIGKTFKEMIVYFPLYMKFVNNTQKAQECLQKCCQENAEFKKLVTHMKISSPAPNKDAITLQEALFMPVQRLQRNTLVLHDLLKSTPEDHRDYQTLQRTLELADHNLKNFALTDKNSVSSTEESAPLVKSGFVVEVVRNSRKLRYLFLFSDVIVCTKHKQSRHRVNSFEVKWYIPMHDIILESKYEKSFSIKEDTENMKKKIVSLKADLRSEMKTHTELVKEKAWAISRNKVARSIEKLKKKIEEQEAALVLASPHLPIQLRVADDSQSPTILLSTDYEREEWRDAILSQQKHQHISFNRQLSGHDIQSMINESKQLPQVNNIGTVLTRKDEEMLNGSLNVTIHKLHGLEEQCDTYVELHLDSFGHFFMQARTRPCRILLEATWDEDFELELDGSQTLRILCYKKTEGEDVLIGRSALELSKQWLKNKFQEQKVPMNELSLTISVRHTPANKTLKRTPSKLQGGIFGYKISTVTNRDRKTVPTFVTSCIKEVESRGLSEVGIYRVSGVTSEVQRIKKSFDKNIRSGLNLLSECDIHAVTGVFKLYLRELPEPLFTQAKYEQFIDATGLHDEYSKEKVFLQLIHELPDENYYTIVAIVEHLVRVSKHESDNKMSISNLATIFGPTLLHPAFTEAQQTPEQLMQDAQDVFIQAAVLSFLLQLAGKGKNIRRSEANIELSGKDVLV